jgi:hypothetical protein
MSIFTYSENFMVARVATIPAAITTQEQLVMWAIMALEESVPSLSYLERPGVTSWADEWQKVKGGDGREYFVGRVVIPLNELSSIPAGGKVWLQAAEHPGAAVIPAYYASN